MEKDEELEAIKREGRRVTDEATDKVLDLLKRNHPNLRSQGGPAFRRLARWSRKIMEIAKKG